LLLLAASASAQQVAIIANRSVPADSLSQREVLDIYSGDVRTWKNGVPVVPFDLSQDGVVRDTFYEYLGKKSSRMKSIWMKNLLMGECQPPRTVDNEIKLLDQVSATPGGIGYLSLQSVNDSVKVLTVIAGSPAPD
jgi:ABC-type phosphate transport system substrate-binding protein